MAVRAAARRAALARDRRRNFTTIHTHPPTAIRANSPPRIGSATDSTLTNTDSTLCAALINGFASPPVPTVLTARVVTVPACTIPATPPPAMIAHAHCNSGLTLVMAPIWLADTIAPAHTAAGVATVSSAWSSHGTLYATISSTVATAKQTIASSVPIHASEGASDAAPSLAAPPSTSSGTNTRNPHAALSPSPSMMASAMSMFSLPGLPPRRSTDPRQSYATIAPGPASASPRPTPASVLLDCPPTLRQFHTGTPTVLTKAATILLALSAAHAAPAMEDTRLAALLDASDQPPTVAGTPDLTFRPAQTPPDQPRRFIHNRDSIPDRPDIIFVFHGRYDLATRADVGGDPGNVRVQRSALAGNLIFGPEHDTQVSLPVDWETSTYSFRDADALFPGGVTRVRNVQQIVFAPNIEVKVNEHWGVFGGGLLIDAGQYTADDTATYGGFAGAIWRSGGPDKTLTIRLGIGARTRLEDDVQILPAFWMEWKLDDRTRLTSQGNNIRFEHDFAPAWCVKVDLAFEQRDYRLNDSSPGPGAVFRDTNIPLTARLEFVPHAATRFEAWIGANLSREFTVDTREDQRFSRSHAAPSLVIGAQFEIYF